ncbi:MAG: hypothetical protein ACK56F_14690, partial [bacterium]
MEPRWPPVGQNDPGLEQFLHRLLGRETPVFLWIGAIQAKTQGAQMAAHNCQEQQRVFSRRHRAPGPPGPHRRTHANGSRSGARHQRCPPPPGRQL